MTPPHGAIIKKKRERHVCIIVTLYRMRKMCDLVTEFIPMFQILGITVNNIHNVPLLIEILIGETDNKQIEV